MDDDSQTPVTIQARDVISVTGADAVGYLHGQLSQGIIDLGDGQSRWSFLLAPTGKVIGLFRITRIDDSTMLIDTDPGAGDAIVARLERFRLRLDVHLRLEPWSIERRWNEGAPLTKADVSTVVVQRAWPVDDGIDVLSRTSRAPVGIDHGEFRRIRAGIPRAGVDFSVDAQAIPAEFGSWFMKGAVDFDKGCYTGQELVLRMHSRGDNAPKPLRLIAVDGDARSHADCEAGDSICFEGVPIATVSSAARSGGHALAMARLPRRVTAGSAVQIRAVSAPHDDEVTARVETLPVGGVESGRVPSAP